MELGNFADYNNVLQSHSFIRQSGGSSSVRGVGYHSQKKSLKLVNLYFIPELSKQLGYTQFKVDNTTLDLTISSIDISTIVQLNQDLEPYNITVRSMYLNNFEFIILFNLTHSETITDINVTLAAMKNEFLNNYRVKKIETGTYTKAFKFYQFIDV